MRPLVILLSSTVIGVILGVVFSRTFPLVEIDAGIVAVCAVAGCLITLIGYGAMMVLKRTV